MKATERYFPLSYVQITPSKTDVSTEGAKKVVGTFDIGSQYHYTMEPQTTVCLPAEDGIDVISSSQWIHATQVSVANCLKMPHNSINMFFRRIGGGYGAKITRSMQIACKFHSDE